MTFITVSATVAIALAYQAFCSSAYEFCSVRPDLLLGGLLTIAASCASVVAVAAALTVGMVVESISLDPPLSHTLSYSLALNLFHTVTPLKFVRCPILSLPDFHH